MIADAAAIVAQGMGVRRGGRWLLRPAAFGLAGGVIGIAGPPGVGKSTLLATFATLRRPHVGALEILGFATGNSSQLRSVRARIGYLPDGFSWAGNLTVGEFVAYAAYYKRVPKRSGHDILQRLELGEVGEMELDLLPADVRLRAGLAATCVHEPDLVLLDEPFSGLGDDESGLGADALVPLIRSLAPTVVVTARTTAELTGWCDQVFTLARGRLTELCTQPSPRQSSNQPPLVAALLGAPTAAFGPTTPEAAPARPEAARTSSARTDPARTDSARADSARADSARADSAREGAHGERLPVGSGACV